MSGQKKVDATVSQVRNPLFVMLSDGRIQNSYHVKMENKTMSPAKFVVGLEGLDGAELDMGQIPDFTLAAEDSQRIMVKVKKPVSKNELNNQEFRFVFTPQEGEVKEPLRINSQFITP